MVSYRSPGVYVEEVPSAVQPIAGVSTSTAAFIGIVPDTINIPIRRVVNERIAIADGQAVFPLARFPVLPPEVDDDFDIRLDPQAVAQLRNTQNGAQLDFNAPLISGAKVTVSFTPARVEHETARRLSNTEFKLKQYPVQTKRGSYSIRVAANADAPATEVGPDAAFLENDENNNQALVKFSADQPDEAIVTVDYVPAPVQNRTVEPVEGNTTSYKVSDYPVVEGNYAVSVDVTDAVRVSADSTNAIARLNFTSAPPANTIISGSYTVGEQFSVTAAGTALLCTNFSEFKRAFGNFSTDAGQRRLAHAVYGFFNNGGTRCYVMRVDSADKIDDELLARLETIDDISLLAAPGITDAKIQEKIISHCEKLEDRFAILDGQPAVSQYTVDAIKGSPPVRDSNYAAMYFPWIDVGDTNEQAEPIYMPPSGHIAGVYARVDTQRGVHKAPANEVIRGALGVSARLSREHQAGLNPAGINVIRDFDGTITIWGARTLGGDANGEWKYLSVRRLFLFLRESIDEGIQWAVFEPNDPSLWARITRNVTAFLTSVWRAGALFGATPQQAFYVKCDAETNPPEVRDLGQVVTEVGVAVVRPAEFVIFRISQWAGPQQ